MITGIIRELIILAFAIPAIVLIIYGVYESVGLHRLSRDYQKFLSIINDYGFRFNEQNKLEESTVGEKSKELQNVTK